MDSLPPTPLVREDDKGGYVAIDGHNLIAVRAYLDQPVEVHIARSPSDGLPNTDEMSMTRNQELAEKFETVLDEAELISSSGIARFSDLIKSNKELFKNR